MTKKLFLLLALAASASAWQARRELPPRQKQAPLPKPQSASTPQPVTPAPESTPKPAPAERPIDSTLGLKLAPIQPAAMRPVKWSTIPNGMRIGVLDGTDLPVVYGSLVVRAGRLHDPAEKLGLSELVQNLLVTAGPVGVGGEEFRDRIESLGVVVNAQVQTGWTRFDFRAPSSQFRQMLPLLKDALASPSFHPEQFDQSIGRFRDLIGSRNQNHAAVANREFQRKSRGSDSRIGRMVEYEHLDNIGREDLVQFHRDHYLPSRTMLVMEGDLPAAELESFAAQVFGSWNPTGGQPVADRPATAAQPAPGWFFAEIGPSPLAAFVFGAPACKRTDGEFPALLVLEQLLTRSLQNLNKSHAKWNLAAATAMDGGFDLPLNLIVRGQVASQYATDALGAISNLLGSAASQAWTDSDFQWARSRAIASVSNALSRAPSRLDLALTEPLFGFSPSHFTQIGKLVGGVAKADVARAASQYLKPESLVRVVVGRESTFDRPLTVLAKSVGVIDLTIPKPKPLVANTDPASIESGKQWLQRLQKEMGGADKLASVRDYRAVWEGVTFGAQEVKIKHTDRWISAETFRQDVETPTQSLSVFYNGKIGWIASGKQIGRLPPELHQQVLGEIFRMPFLLALSDRDPTRTVAHLGANILQITGPNGQGVRIYIDNETGLPQRMSYTVVERGTSVSREETFEDWRDTSGFRMPGKVTIKQNGRRIMEHKLVEAAFNSKMKLEDVERKP